MKTSKAKEILIPTVTLFLICLIATVLLAFTNSATEEKIKQNAVETETNSRVLVLPDAKEFGEVNTDEESGLTYCEGKDESGKVIGYVITSSAKGYGGDVIVMIGYDTDAVITGLEILDCSNETPGLGQNSKTPEFKNRFVGKSGELTVDKYSNEGQSLQAITAATITSKAVVRSVNAATVLAEKLTKAGESNG